MTLPARAIDGPEGPVRLGEDLRVRCVAKRAFIACFREDVSTLQGHLMAQGIATQEMRGTYSRKELAYSPNIRCLLTHRQIWRTCESLEGQTLVVEADFVPVRRFGECRVPSGWLERPGFAWLYSVSPTFYRLDGTGAAIGEGAGTVAYLLSGAVAAAMLEFSEEILAGPDPCAYRLWETEFRTFLRNRKGIPTYVPYRHYGEHGGRPNPEHLRNRGFPPHRADCLLGPLAFVPDYAEGQRWRARRVRAAAKIKGFARLALGRALPLASYRNEPDPRLIWFAISRLLTLY